MEGISKTSEAEVVNHNHDDDLMSNSTPESGNTTPDDLIYDTISHPLALCIATVFEDMGDKLALVGHSLHTPFVDVRTRPSLDIHNSQRPQFDETVVSDTNEEEVWVLRQLYSTRIPYKLKGLVEPSTEQKPSVTEIMKRCGVKTNSQSERYQKIRIQLHLMANSVVSEMLLDSSIHSLLKRIETENTEKEEVLEQIRKVKHHQDYIYEMQVSIKQAKIQKLAEKKNLRVDIHHLTNMLLEQDYRANLEEKYMRKLGKSKIRIMRKSNFARETRSHRELETSKKRSQLEYHAHDAMVKVIGQKFNETTILLDIAIDKYEKDYASLTARLEALYRDRRRDLERIAWLQKRIVDYERVVVDDRRIKTREADKIRKKLRENKKATKIQAWWRGVMVRKWLGSFTQMFIDLYEAKARRKEARANQKGKPKPKPKPKAK